MEFDQVDSNVSKKQGNVGVARAVYEYVRRGYTVSLPTSDSEKYDLIVDIDGTLFKVQVKTSRCKIGNRYQVNLATSGGNTKEYTVRKRRRNDYDILFCLIETGECWSIPVEALGAAGKAISVTASKYEPYRLT